MVDEGGGGDEMRMREKGGWRDFQGVFVYFSSAQMNGDGGFYRNG